MAPDGAAIRPCIPADLPQIAAIYAEHALHGTGTFDTEPPPPETHASCLRDLDAAGLPFFGAFEGTRLLGYAYAAPFRTRAAYAGTLEDSVYIAPNAQRRGVGAALLHRIVETSARAGFEQMLAVIGDSGNAASIGLHRRLGFAHAGTLTGVGRKFGRTLDVVLMQRPLQIENASV